MPKTKSISTKTVTLLIGIIVALFLFLSATLFNQEKKAQEELSEEPIAGTTQTLNIIHKGTTSVLSIFEKFK